MGDVGLRERKKRATRHALQREALRLVVERGLDHVTVEEIAGAADVSPRTFFNYFSSKEDALAGEGPPRPDPERLREFARGGPTGELGEDLKRLLLSSIDEYTPSVHEIRRRKELLSRHPELLTPRFMSAFVDMERELAEAVAQRAGEDADQLRPQLIAAIAGATMRLSVRRWVCSGGEDELRTVVSEAFDTLKGGV